MPTDKEIQYFNEEVIQDKGKTDLVMVTYFRRDLTAQCLSRLFNYTKTPYRLTVIDNGSTDGTKDLLMSLKNKIDNIILLDKNYGLEYARNTALRHIHSPYCVFFDNDLLVPNLEPDWLSQQIALIKKYPEYGCIALRPQVLVGAVEQNPDTEVIENNHVGATFMMFPTVLIKGIGWDDSFTNRVADWRLGDLFKEKGLKMGWARDIRCYHIFGKNWSYPEGVSHFHREIWPPAEHYDNVKVDPDTLRPLN
jgi:glycosyltransferase involved in cell wall biosynthesis